MNKRTLAAAAVAALALPATAQAHVTLQPSEATAGGYTVENVRVPNETDDAVTTKVDVQFPSGFAGASYQATPGWKVKVTTKKLAEPIKTDDGEMTEEVSRVVWTADSKADGIAPGEFRDFPLSVKIPDKPGTKLTFKALQTYSDGEIVRWIGAPDSDEPAPQVSVMAADDDEAAHGTETTAAAAPPTATVSADDDDDDASKGLGIAALVLGGLGLVAGGIALARSRG